MMKSMTTLTKRFMRAAALVALCLPALDVPARAASSEWIGTKGGKLRLVALPPDAQGIIRGFVEIAPEAGWHTYWKVPGSGGIPPQVTIRDGGNVRLSKLEFPAPRVFEDGGLRDFGYDARVMLPLTLTQEKVGAPSSVNASIFIGLCADICVPFQADVSVKLGPDDKPKSTELALVNAASALLPEAPGADFAVEDARLNADGKALSVGLRLPPGADAGATEVIVVGPDGQPFAKPTQISVKDRVLVLQSKLPGAEPGALAGKTIGILALSAGRAMETQVKLP